MSTEIHATSTTKLTSETDISYEHYLSRTASHDIANAHFSGVPSKS